MSAKGGWSLMLAAGLAIASNLQVHTDGAYYRYTPRGTFVGFGGSLEAYCGHRPVTLRKTAECPDSMTLCQPYLSLRQLALEAKTARYRAELLRQTVSQTRREVLDAKGLIRFCEATGARAARWETEAKEKEAAQKRLRQLFQSRARSSYPMALSRICDKEVTLVLPAGTVGVQVDYEADISQKEKNRVTVTQTVRLSNRSGIDLTADEVDIFADAMGRYLSPYRFTPWLVRQKSAAKQMPRRVRHAAPMAMLAEAEAVMPSDVSVEAPRRYRLTDVRLPAFAEPVRVRLRRWEQEAEYGETAFVYRDRRVYETLTFRPRYPIDNDNRWRIQKGDTLVARQVRGLYDKERYLLFLRADPDIDLNKRRLHLKGKESFFGTSVRRRDGYEITLVNRSNRTKRLRLVERIPVATRPDVSVKLTRIKAKGARVRHTLKREGRLDMELTLKPRAAVTIEVRFEVTFDKKAPVIY